MIEQVNSSKRVIVAVVGLSVWLGVGFLIVVFESPFNKPTSLPTLILWCAVAPLLYVVAEALVVGPAHLLSKIPPFSWLFRWIRCEDGEGDPLLRFCAAAAVFLVVFFVALRLVFDYP
jgi:hypothetical protein